LIKVWEQENNFLSIIALFASIIVFIRHITFNFGLCYSYRVCSYIQYIHHQNVLCKTIMKYFLPNVKYAL